MNWTQAELQAYQLRRAAKYTIPTRADAVERERFLHQQILDDCRRRGWIVLHGSMADPTRRTIGEWDTVIVASGGRVLFCELKSKTGKLTREQAGLKLWAEGLGHQSHVIRSFAEFVRIADCVETPQLSSSCQTTPT